MSKRGTARISSTDHHSLFWADASGNGASRREPRSLVAHWNYGPNDA